MASRQFPLYMPDAAWDHIETLRKDDPRKGRGAVVAELILADKERREKAEKRKASELEKTA